MPGVSTAYFGRALRSNPINQDARLARSVTTVWGSSKKTNKHPAMPFDWKLAVTGNHQQGTNEG